MTEPSHKIHPLVIAASIAVILFSLVGIAAMTGLLPRHNSSSEAPPQSAEPARPPEGPRTPLGPLPQPMSQIPPGAIQPSVCGDCGVITGIRLVEKQGEGGALGVVAGGVVGGILGHQVGGGSGKDIATIAGALGGGYAGNEIEKRTNSSQTHEVTVRMDDGRTHNLNQQASPAFRVGDRVRVINGAIRPY